MTPSTRYARRKQGMMILVTVLVISFTVSRLVLPSIRFHETSVEDQSPFHPRVQLPRRWNITRVNEWLQDPNQLRPPATPGAFVHIGKAGGSTLCKYLRNACHSWVKKPCNPNIANETRLSHLVTYYHTPDFGILHKRSYSFYAVTLREPFARFRSIFAAAHYHNILARQKVGTSKKTLGMKHREEFAKCFASFNDFASAIGAIGSEESSGCVAMAAAILQHRKEYSEHWYWDIHHLYQIVSNRSQDAAILALRTEYLWQDWVSANQFLGQERVVAPANAAKQRDYSSIELPVQMNITETNHQRLCLALREEYEAYFAFLRRAGNLQDRERQASVEQSRENCPWLDLSLDYQRS